MKQKESSNYEQEKENQRFDLRKLLLIIRKLRKIRHY